MNKETSFRKESFTDEQLRELTISELFDIRKEHTLYPDSFSAQILDQITNELARRLYFNG